MAVGVLFIPKPTLTEHGGKISHKEGYEVHGLWLPPRTEHTYVLSPFRNE